MNLRYVSGLLLRFFVKATLCAAVVSFGVQEVYAACAATTRTWDSGGGNDNWTNATNWSNNNVPGSGENATIIAGQRDAQVDQDTNVSCVDVQSGLLTDRGGRSLTIEGDYFRNLTPNSVIFDSTTFWVQLSGTAPQTFENVDSVENIEIANDTTVTFTHDFIVDRELRFAAGWTGTLYINADVFMSIYQPLVIPAGGTVVINSGAVVTTWDDWTINGTLKIMPGGQLRPGMNETITVGATGTLIMAGAPANPAVIAAQGSTDTMTVTINGILNANYFQFSRMKTLGLNINGGVVQKLDNGEFHYPAANGDSMTVAAGSTLPATMTNVGFMNDAGAANVTNIDADAYNGSISTLNNWSGGNGGAANEKDNNNKIAWGTQAGTTISVVDSSDPPFTINQNTTSTLANFSFALNQPSTATNITSIKLTQTGTAAATDIEYIEVWRDGAGSRNCLYNGGGDVDMTGQVQLTGSPPSYTVAVAPGDISTSSDTDSYCIHVRVHTTANAVDAKTIQMSISGTADVVNSQGYSFSTSSSPPVSQTPATSINGDAVRKWEGTTNSNWNNANNWTGGIPSNTRDCEIGVGQNTTLLNVATGSCQNGTLKTGGTLNFNNTTNELSLRAGLTVQSGFTFQNTTAGPGVIAMRGNASQGMTITTEYPGDVLIANTGVVNDETVAVNGDSIIGGDLTVSNGILRINSPSTLTVRGDLTCQTGTEIEILAGATLEMGDGSTLTIDNGCVFTIVGNTSENAVVTSDAGTSAYNVVVNGTIEARYYTFDHLGTAGVSIESGATINATNHLQDGTFSFPVNNNSTLLYLKQKVPTDSLDNMTFSLDGSTVTGSTNVNTTGAAAGTLTLNSYTGDIAGPDYDNESVYLISWLGATNTIKLTQEATSPASLDAGSTYNMGRFGFQQDLAGASYVDTDVTSLKLTLTGTASSNDISEVKAYYDSNCDGAAGTLIDSGSFAGNPGTVTLSFTAGEFTVESDLTTPPKRCVYVEYVMSPTAIDGNTAGVKIAVAGDVANSQSYGINSGTLPPIDLGTAGTIVGATTTTWNGTVSTDWFNGSNWSNGVPTATTTCSIDSSTFDPNINGGSGTAVCKNVAIGNGTVTLQNGTSAVLEVYGSYTNTGTVNQNDGTLRIRDDGVTATNQSITSSSTISSLTFNKTAAGGQVYLSSSNLTITTLTFPAGSDFEFAIPNGKTLTLPNSTTVVGATFSIEAGGTLKMGNGTTFTVNSGASLKMVGTAVNNAIMTSDAGGSAFDVVINGGIEARFYTFDHLGVNGVSVESGATIDGTNSLKDGTYSYPVNNSGTMLKLKKQVPGNTMNDMSFDLGGSTATGTKNIDTTGAAAGTLSINNYSGDVSGPTFDTDPTYTISWSGATNTIDLTQEGATTPTPLVAGNTYVMGRFAFQQNLAGASFSDADLTSLKLTLTGTGAGTDVDTIRIYFDSDCNSAGGTEIGSGSFSGNPSSVTFTIAAGDAVIPADVASPPKRCIYVEYDISAGAVDAKTLGVEIAADSHVANDQGYEISPSTPTPINLGTPGTITGSTVTNWTGGASTTDWFTAGNWDGGVPSATKNCVIDDQTFDPNINGGSGTAVCKSVTIGTGIVTLQNGTSAILEANGNFTNNGTLISNDGTVRIADGGAGSNHTIISNSAIGTLNFTKTSGGVVSIGSSVLQINTLTIPASSNFEFKVLSGKNLKLPNGVTFGDITFTIAAGGTVSVGDGSTVTVNSGGVLKMVGTSSVNRAVMSADGASAAYNVVINTGEINANYYTFDHLGVAGVSIESGATINATNHLQNGNFIYPVNNSTTLLSLKKVVPTNSMNGAHFDLNGSSATSTTNVDTTGAASGTLTIDSYTGDLAGPSNDVDPVYTISWTGAQNTLDLTQDATGPSSLDAGSTYNMGRFRFTQTQAGASYSDTDITQLVLTLIGTATSSDISQARIYYDSDCDSAAGTLIGSGTFSGSPLKKTFNISAGDATVHAHASLPPGRCIYVEYDIALAATGNNTVGARITASGDVVNSQSYGFNAAADPPVNLGALGTIAGAPDTDWTGTISTDWFDGGNWTAGVPTSSESCSITNVANDPVINGGSGTAYCKNVVINGGILTLQNGTSAVLEVAGNYDNSGTLTQNDGTLRMDDSGGGVNQTFSSTTTVSALTFDKTGGGEVKITSSMTLNSLTLPGGSNFVFKVPSGVTLTMPNGFSVPAGTFRIDGGGTVAVGNTQTITVNGGTFSIAGINDSFIQAGGNKGKVTVSGAGRWGFTATSGTVDLTGFWLDYMDDNGLNIGGSTNLNNLNGGQFTHLSTNFALPMKAIQINTTGTVPVTASNVGWNWDGFNSANAASSCCEPTPAQNYYLVYAPNCSSNTINFDQWFGDFMNTATDLDNETKVHDTDDGGPTCQISIAASASPVSLASFSATGYDGAVSVDWETVTELDHAGFNVYRSLNPEDGYIQVNPSLIRNFLASTLLRGTYRYVDNDVVNGQTYFYKIEDVAFNGTKEMHGPKQATPMAAYDPAPADDADTNSGSSDSGTDTGNAPVQGSIENPGLVDLGNGVHILSQTENSLRVEIIPPPASFAAATWDNTYETISVPGYSKVLESGSPELVERVILIEVSRARTGAQLTNSVNTEAGLASHKISPAPTWAADGGGVLQPSYAEDLAVYSVSGLAPAAYFELSNVVKELNGKKYVQIKVKPFKYDPVAQQTNNATKIVLDIGLDGSDAWDQPTGNTDLASSPAAVEGVMRIKYGKAGMYEVTYDEMAAAGVEGPFAGKDVNEFRLFYHGTEIPMEIVSGTGFFVSGDKFRYYAHHERSYEDDDDEVVLSAYNLMDSGDSPLRIVHLNGDPSGMSLTTEEGTWASSTAEQDLNPLFDYPIGDLMDHMYWKRIYLQRGGMTSPAPTDSYLDVNINLPELNRSASTSVYVRVHVRALGVFAKNSTHHLGIYVNSVPFMVADKSFDEQMPTVLTFELPADYMLSGSNNIRLQVLADLVPPGDWDMMDIDRVEVDYVAHRIASNDVAKVLHKVTDTQLTIDGFSSATGINVYDISKVDLGVAVLDTVSITGPDANSEYSATFASLTGTDGETGRYFIGVRDGSFEKPNGVFLGWGADSSLRSTSNGADLIVIGGADLIDAAEELIDLRISQGLRVVSAPLDRVYAEFSSGRVSSQAIRDFVTFARANWQAPAPQYLLLLGDATYDSRDRLGYGKRKNLMPMPIHQGIYMDFGNDHWFVSDENDLPTMAVGRIPTSDVGQLYDYVNKLIAYESGERSPTDSGGGSSLFIADKSTMNENFDKNSLSLASSLESAQAMYSTRQLDLEAYATDADAKTALISEFDSGPLLMTYLGHGAEDQWANSNFFEVSDADNLSNGKMPIVMALNCLNSYFYDPDPTFTSIGEHLIFNKGGGAIAFWGSTSLTTPPVQLNIANNFYNELGVETSQAYHDVRLGDLITRAKIQLGSKPSTQDTIRSWTLFGDPTMKLPSTAFKYEPASVTPDPAPVAREEGGGGGCGMVVPPSGGSGGGIPPGAWWIVMLFPMALLASKKIKLAI